MSQLTWPVLLNDGVELRATSCGAAEGVLWITIPGMTINEAVLIFSNPEKTSKIIAYDSVEHLNYTELINLSIDYDKQIRVALRKVL